MKTRFRLAALVPWMLLAGGVAAQQADAVNNAAPPTRKLEEIVVTGNPLRGAEVVVPVSTLAGDDLVLKRGATLGETLGGMPGVSNSSFGPNAGRPVIRGLDGDRIRVLSNSGASFDASNVSVDHNAAIDPLAIERVEVLRGPAALLYGGGAIGGVVNVIDNRIPREPIRGSGGVVESRFGGAERERGLSTLFESGNDVLALHADAFHRSTADYQVPEAAGRGARIVNSASRSKGGALGASFTFRDGHLGVSRSEYRTEYGTVAEPDVTIDMRQSRTTLEAEVNNLGGLIDGVTARGGQTDYQHVELEGGAVGTRFTNAGRDFRLEAKHARLGGLAGVIGVQAESFSFAALGEEAFVPATRSRNQALFAYEEAESGPWKISFGGRAERSRVHADGEAGTGIARFGAASSKSFQMASYSAGIRYALSTVASLTASVARSERSPAFYELYANGPHVATAAYELGDTGLQGEKSNALDAGVQWRWGAEGKSSARLGVFTNRFDNYIALRRSGIARDTAGNNTVTDCGDGTSAETGCAAGILPEFRYQGVNARLSGFEAELRLRLMNQPDTLDWELKVDLTRAQDLTNAEPLPRVAPLRINQAAIYANGPWALRGELETSSRQWRVPAKDVGGATPGYTLIHAALSYRVKRPDATLLLFAKVSNLGNQLAYNAASVDTVRRLAPLPGRGIKVGAQLSF